jgi:PAS domain S-box-containing protein
MRAMPASPGRGPRLRGPGLRGPGLPGPGLRGLIMAVLITGAAILGRAKLEAISPGVRYFGTLLPVFMFTGIAFGRMPGIVSAVCGIAVTAWVFLGPAALFASPVNPSQLAVLLVAAAAAIVLRAAHYLRGKIHAAQAAEARLAEIFRQIPGAAVIIEAPDGRVMLRSVKAAGVLGQRPQHAGSVLALNADGGMHQDGQPYAAGEYPITRALRAGETVAGEHLLYRRTDGRIADLEVHVGPVRGADGQIVAAVGMAFDVTARMQAERRLRASDAQHCATAGRLQAAIDAGGLGLWELDLATERIHIDAMMAAMLGMKPVPVVLERGALAALIHPDDAARTHAVLDAALAKGGIYADECRMRLPNGAIIWVVTHGNVLPGMRKAIGVISDVTERRGREEALIDALRMRDVLMHEADHRIKNSLQLVVSLLRLQLSKAANLETRHALREAMARVDAVANAHLALQRSADLRGIDIDHMLEDLCAHLGELNPALDLQCDAGSGVCLDAEQAIPLALIASELLTNALRHAFEPTTSGVVRLTVGHEAGTLSLTVADSGKGFSVAAQKAGLGSAVIVNLARQIGAATATRSAPGAGTSVHLSLAVMQQSAKVNQAEASS